MSGDEQCRDATQFGDATAPWWGCPFDGKHSYHCIQRSDRSEVPLVTVEHGPVRTWRPMLRLPVRPT